MLRTYDYTCLECGYKWSHFQDGYEEKYNATKCPVCDNNILRREFPAPVIHVFYSPCHPRYKRGTG